MADRKRKPQRRATVPTSPEAAQTAEEAQAEEELNEAEKKLLAQLRARRAVRPQAPRVKVRHEPPGPMTLAATDGRELGHLLALLSTFGTASIDFQVRTLHELMEASCRGGNRIALEEWDVNGALAALHGIAPRDEAEALLAAQMVAVHSAAMRCLRQLKAIGEHPAAGLQRQPRGQAAAHVHGADGGASALPRQGRAEDDGRARSRPRRRPSNCRRGQSGQPGGGAASQTGGTSPCKSDCPCT